MRLPTLRLALALLLPLAACDLRPPHLVLTVEDPESVAATAATLAVGFRPDSLSETPLAGKTFKLTVAVVAPSAGTHTLYVEARDGSGKPLARGLVSATFPEKSTGTATATLARSCASSPDCDDGLYCNGTETCEGTFPACVRSAAPCTNPPYPCITLTCVEAAKNCNLAVDHTRCSPATLPDGTVQPRYCDPGSGCVPGKACTTKDECQDESVCNGEEECTYHHCVGGPAFNASDDDPCTVDFCTDPAGKTNLADPKLAGAPCTLPGDSRSRLCIRGACVVSRCGDGVVDSRKEACDDGNDDPNDGCDRCARTTWDTSVVTGLGRHRGDPRLLTIEYPGQLAVARTGTLFVTDFYGDRIWRVDGDLATVAAGLGRSGFSGDGGPAPAAAFDGSVSTAVDGDGNLYVADLNNDRIRRVDARTGIITTLAGGGVGTADGIPATASSVNRPQDLVVDGLGNVYFIDKARALVRRVEAETGLVHTIAGSETAPAVVDGPALATKLDAPKALALFGADTLYVAEATMVRRITLARPLDPASGTIVRVAGNGTTPSSGTGVAALTAAVASPQAMAVDAFGNLYLADYPMHAIRRITWNLETPALSQIDTVVGNGTNDRPIEGPALASPLGDPMGIGFAPDGSMILAEVSSGSVLRVTRPGADPAQWQLTRIAGGQADIDVMEGSPATTTRLWTTSLAARGGKLYFTDYDRDVIWSVDLSDPHDVLTWTLRRVAGGGDSLAEGIPAKEASLTLVQDKRQGTMVMGPDDSLYVADTGNHRVRRVRLSTGIIETVAGNGDATTSGDGGKALAAGVRLPDVLALDPAGRLFVAGDMRVRAVQTSTDPVADWTIALAAGTGAAGGAGDGGPARSATFVDLWGLSASATHLFLADSKQHSIRGVDTTGAAASWPIFRVAGSGAPGYTGDGGLARTATLNEPWGLAHDAARNLLYVADNENTVVRRINLTGAPAAWTIDTLNKAGTTNNNFDGDGRPIGEAKLWGPRGFALGDDGELFVNQFDTIRRVVFGDRADPKTWIVSTVMGGSDPEGDGALVSGGLGAPSALARFDANHLAVADGPNGRVRWVDLSASQVRTVAGYPGGMLPTAGTAGSARYSRLFGDASGIAFDPLKNLFYVTDAKGHHVRRVAVTDLAKPWTWTSEDWAGQAGEPGHVDGALAAARFFGPTGLAFDATARVLYVAEGTNQDLRAIKVDQPTAADCVSTIAGLPGRLGFLDGTASEALFHGPTALVLDGKGGLYVADTGNHRVRRVDLAAKSVKTVLGTGQPGSSGVGAPAQSLPVDNPRGLAVDSQGNLFVSSSDTLRLVTRSEAGDVASGLGQVLTLFGPGTPSRWAPVTRCLTGLMLLPGEASLLALDQCQGYLLRLDRK